jgi:hypothetical protein
LAGALAGVVILFAPKLQAVSLLNPVHLSDITYGSGLKTYNNGTITNVAGVTKTVSDWKSDLSSAYGNDLGGVWTFEDLQYIGTDQATSKTSPLPTTLNLQYGTSQNSANVLTVTTSTTGSTAGISRKTGSSTFTGSSGVYSGIFGSGDSFAPMSNTLTFTAPAGRNLNQIGFVQLNRSFDRASPTVTWTATFSDSTTQTESITIPLQSSGGSFYYFTAPAGKSISTLAYAASNTTLDPFDDMGFVLAPTVSGTTYTLSAAAGGDLVDNRLTQGQSTNLTATITNTGTGTADTLDFTGLSVGGVAVNPASGSAVANSGGNASGTRIFTATTLGSIALNPTATAASNHTLSTPATAGAVTATTVLVDALVEHTTIFDADSPSTSSTAAYRQDDLANGNLGSVTVTKAAAGDYLPGYADGINSGNGVKAGTLTINVTGGSGFAPDPSVFLLDLSSITNASNPANGLDAGLSALENELAADGYSYVDRFGNTNANLTTVDLNTFRTLSRDYDLELLFNPGPASSPSYFDFNFANSSYNSIGNVVNIAAVPEPAGCGLLIAAAVAAMSMRWRKRSTSVQPCGKSGSGSV